MIVLPTSVSASEARWWGAFVNPFPSKPVQADVLDSFSQLVGKQPQLFMYYDPWGYDFKVDAVTAIEARNAVPMLSWMPDGDLGTNFSNVLSGQFDGYLRKYAQDINLHAKPLFLRLALEMNGDWFTYGSGVNGNTPAGFISMWRHVHDIFQQVGANRYVVWVWCPNVEAKQTPTFVQFYPGDAYVDWVGLDGYNWGSPWQSFSQVFQDSYAAITTLTNKPLLIGEMGSAELSGQDKGNWIKSAFLTELPQQFPLIKGWIWYQKNSQQNWLLDSSATSLAAFREVIQLDQYGGTVQMRPSVCAADLDANNFVDVSDYGALVHDLVAETKLYAKSDINSDGYVDITDYSLLVRSFLQDCF